MIVVAFVSFSLFNFVGDPVNSMTGEDASDERRAEVREVLGLNDPVYIQFSKFIGNVIQGDFGISYQLKREVSDLIAERMPATLELVFVSALLAIITGVILGVYTGIHREINASNHCNSQYILNSYIQCVVQISVLKDSRCNIQGEVHTTVHSDVLTYNSIKDGSKSSYTTI